MKTTKPQPIPQFHAQEPQNAPAHMDADQAIAWAQGYNAANEAVEEAMRKLWTSTWYSSTGVHRYAVRDIINQVNGEGRL